MVPGCLRTGVFLWDNILAKKRIVCYIDGFNLYHSIDDLGPKFNYLKWLNLWSLTHAFLKNYTEQLISVYYFSALAHWLRDPKYRHEEFLKANSYFGVTPFLVTITRELRGIVTAQKIKQKHLKNNQLPDLIKDKSTGSIIALRPRNISHNLRKEIFLSIAYNYGDTLH